MNPYIFSMLTLPVRAVWMGFVMTRVWLWFVTPFGVEPIGIAHAIGLVLTIRVLMAPAYRKPAEEMTLNNEVRDFVFGLIGGAFLLGVGWLVQGMM